MHQVKRFIVLDNNESLNNEVGRGSRFEVDPDLINRLDAQIQQLTRRSESIQIAKVRCFSRRWFKGVLCMHDGGLETKKINYQKRVKNLRKRKMMILQKIAKLEKQASKRRRGNTVHTIVVSDTILAIEELSK